MIVLSSVPRKQPLAEDCRPRCERECDWWGFYFLRERGFTAAEIMRGTRREPTNGTGVERAYTFLVGAKCCTAERAC
jgi:hypothetical protein